QHSAAHRVIDLVPHCYSSPRVSPASPPAWTRQTRNFMSGAAFEPTPAMPTSIGRTGAIAGVNHQICEIIPRIGTNPLFAQKLAKSEGAPTPRRWPHARVEC